MLNSAFIPVQAPAKSLMLREQTQNYLKKTDALPIPVLLRKICPNTVKFPLGGQETPRLSASGHCSHWSDFSEH